jgi:hypothetical protein
MWSGLVEPGVDWSLHRPTQTPRTGKQGKKQPGRPLGPRSQSMDGGLVRACSPPRCCRKDLTCRSSDDASRGAANNSGAEGPPRLGRLPIQAAVPSPAQAGASRPSVALGGIPARRIKTPRGLSRFHHSFRPLFAWPWQCVSWAPADVLARPLQGLGCMIASGSRRCAGLRTGRDPGVLGMGGVCCWCCRHR